MDVPDMRSVDPRLTAYRSAVGLMRGGTYQVNIPDSVLDDLGCLGQELNDLAHTLERQDRERQKLDKIIVSINSGLMLEDILENIYRDFREIIPYNRIGLSLIEKDNRRVTAIWSKSDQPDVKIGTGYSAPLSGSSLEKIIKTGQPRMINDLILYLKSKPQSESTHLIVAEGIRSSLTCPLLINNTPIGFLFFSSSEPNTYSRYHVDTFKKIAQQVSLCVEKGRLVSELAASKAAIEAQNEELRRLNEIKNNLIGVAAHDLRNPLSQIQLASTLVLEPEPWLSEEERNSLLKSILEGIEQHTRQMLNRLNELLDVSQIEAGELNLRFESIEMKSFVEEIVQGHVLLAANKGVTLILDKASSGNLVADPHRLRQVLDHLITAFLYFTDNGNTVCVSSDLNGSLWVVTMEDRAKKNCHETSGEFLEDFSSASALLESGLGMAICRRVVEAHGGELSLCSAPGNGFQVSVTLPY
jgi:signal transduction histidine kinase